MIESLGSWLVNPWLFAGGAVLVSAPIIIHLLNKRRFKTVEWAAMDFLLEADKKNHRRIRIENLILLLLRCLAVLLLALLVARPFRSLGIAGGVLDTVRYERIVLLDDSLSMGARIDDRTAFDVAKKGLELFVDGLASNDTEDTLTVILASQPNSRLNGLHGALVTDETKTEIIQRIRDLALSDRPVDYGEAIAAVEKQMSGPSGEINRAVYIVSDLRARDWTAQRKSGTPGALAMLKQIAAKSAGCYVVNAGPEDAPNLTATAIVPVGKALVAGVEAEFDAFVRNSGPREAANVAVRFTAGDSPPQTGRIRAIAAGQTESIRFRYLFSRPLPDAAGRITAPEPVRIKAEVLAAARVADDQLPNDNVRYFAARVVPGIPVLVVDGDPSDKPNRSESFYIRRALQPLVESREDQRTGMLVKVLSDDRLGDEKLDPYQIIYLCNVARVANDLRDRLEDWVRRGGRLVMALGDHVDEEFYNRELFREGKGLSPLRLEGIRGDETEQKWASFRIERPNHPVLKPMQADGVSFLEHVKVFRWWASEAPKPAVPEIATGIKPAGKAKAKSPPKDVATVPLMLVADREYPAVAEKSFGSGRVVVVTTPCDADWSDWPADPITYLPFYLELTSYLTPRGADEGTVTVAAPLVHEFDLDEFDPTAELQTPGKTKITVHASVGRVSNPSVIRQASGKDGSKTRPTAAKSPAGRLRRFEHAEVDRSGFYTMTLTRTNGSKQNQLFAANIDPDEGDLKPVDRQAFAKSVGESVRIILPNELASLGLEGAKGELWLWILIALVAVLFLEQILGWYFGTKR
jgi:Aerotolerance regulator N-terminal